MSTPYDTGNGLLGPGQSELMTAIGDTAQGQKAIVTLRTSSATVTVFVTKDELDTWSRQMAQIAGMMSDSGLIISTTPITNGSGPAQLP